MHRIISILFLIIADFVSKQWIFNSIDLNNFKKITFFFDLAHIHNFGISFGLFADLFPAWIFIILGVLITAFVFFMYLGSSKSIEKNGLILIFAGASANIIDRAYNGYVIDFIYLHYNQFYWPAFNFADIYISIGILLIILQYLKDLYKR